MLVNNASRNWLFQDHLYFSRSLFTSNRFRTQRNHFQLTGFNTYRRRANYLILLCVVFSIWIRRIILSINIAEFLGVDNITDKFRIIKPEKTEQEDMGFFTTWLHFPLNFYVLLNNILKKSNFLSHNVTTTSFTYCKLFIPFHNIKYIAELLSPLQTSL